MNQHQDLSAGVNFNLSGIDLSSREILTGPLDQPSKSASRIEINIAKKSDLLIARASPRISTIRDLIGEQDWQALLDYVPEGQEATAGLFRPLEGNPADLGLVVGRPMAVIREMEKLAYHRLPIQFDFNPRIAAEEDGSLEFNLTLCWNHAARGGFKPPPFSLEESQAEEREALAAELTALRAAIEGNK